jgi:CheY-like chemotaxis protein/DNA-directed RNA polymerase subunit RPC12/RpoP
MTIIHKNRILIINSDDKMRQIYSDLFKKNSFDVLEAKDGVEGLEIATSEDKINVIFTGVIMPRMDGFQLVEALKEYPNTAEIPVVVSSNSGRKEDQERMKELGVVDFIVHGVTAPQEIVKRINTTINQGEYLLKIDSQELDAQRLVEEHNLPFDLKCSNCGTSLAFKARYGKSGKLTAQIICPNCGKEY